MAGQRGMGSIRLLLYAYRMAGNGKALSATINLASGDGFNVFFLPRSIYIYILYI
jgi:hypothetical protein